MSKSEKETGDAFTESAPEIRTHDQVSKLSELDLRRLQLGEIRALLRLPRDATHVEVLRRLVELGKAPTVDLSAVPERYKGWFGR